MPNDMSCCGYKYGLIIKPSFYMPYVFPKDPIDIRSFIANYLEKKEIHKGIELSERFKKEKIIDFNCLSGLSLKEIKTFDQHGILSNGSYMFLSCMILLVIILIHLQEMIL